MLDCGPGELLSSCCLVSCQYLPQFLLILVPTLPMDFLAIIVPGYATLKRLMEFGYMLFWAGLYKPNTYIALGSNTPSTASREQARWPAFVAPLRDIISCSLLSDFLSLPLVCT